MSNKNLVNIINLCQGFMSSAEHMIESSPSLEMQSKKSKQPYAAEDESLKVHSNALAFKGLISGKNIEDDIDYLNTNIRRIEIFAIAVSHVLEAQDIWSALPENLRGNSKAAQLLSEHNASAMADLCMIDPG